MIKLRCPECNAHLELDANRDYAFCQYCGTKMYLIDKSEHTERIIDDAAIRKEEIKLEMLKEKHRQENKNDRDLLLYLIGCVIFGLIMVAFTS